VLSALLLAAPEPFVPPQRLAIYYGYPSLVNGARGDLARASSVFLEYDVVVFGDGLEFETGGPAHAAGTAEHAFTKQLIARLASSARRPSVLGYIAIGSTEWLSLAEIVDRIDRWARMGADGVLLDEAGFDFGVTRERQNLVVTAAHVRGLRVCLNAFRPADVLGTAVVPLNAAGGGNPDGTPPVLSSRDAILLESFAVRNGEPERPAAFADRVRSALEGRRRLGTRVFAIATGGDRADSSLAQYAWWTAAAFGLDAFGWGMPHYSAVTSQLPWLPRPAVERSLAGAMFTGDVVVRDGRLRRATTRGDIVVDPESQQGLFTAR
jgi:hypothetical protein